MESKYWPVIRKVYTEFNERNIDAVFSVMNPDIPWPKAFEGGYITGYDAVKAYWTSQWKEINPKVEPTNIVECLDGKVEVTVDQLVKDMEGNVIFHGTVKHFQKSFCVTKSSNLFVSSLLKRFVSSIAEPVFSPFLR